MISYIRGELAGLERDKAIVDVQGVGYGIYMPEQSLSLLGPIGCEVKNSHVSECAGRCDAAVWISDKRRS